jgi:hypothetical protein
VCGDDNLELQIHGKAIADIWAACDGGQDQAAKDLQECLLLGGEGCADELASVDFKTGYVWFNEGYNFVKVCNYFCDTCFILVLSVVAAHSQCT